MKLTVLRYEDTGKETLGLLFIDGKFECHTLEDEKREVKLRGETRIPEGEYNVVLRTEGTHHTDYLKKFPKEHIGMLHIIDVPNFQWILIHIGNTEKDTEGCLLVGNKAGQTTIEESTVAYVEMYRKVSAALKKGEKVTIKYVDLTTWIQKF